VTFAANLSAFFTFGFPRRTTQETGPEPAPRLPGAVTGLTHDLVVPADLPIALGWLYPVTSVKRTDLLQ
jgi:hypothetical protein